MFKPDWRYLRYQTVLFSLESRCNHGALIAQIRTYKINPGLGTEFFETFESTVWSEHAKIGMKILGPVLLS